MDFFVQLLINGISIGFLYGLSAMGFVMIFKSSSVLNFAHGEVLAFGAFLFLALVTWAQLPIWLGFLVTLAGTFVLGFVIERIFLRPLIGEPLIQVIMLTVGLAAMFKGGMLLRLGRKPLHLPGLPARGAGHQLGHRPGAARLRGGRHHRQPVSAHVRSVLQVLVPGHLHALRRG